MNKKLQYVCTLSPRRIEKIASFDWLDAINSGIASCGFFMVGVIPEKDKDISQEDSAYCYSIGLAQKGSFDVCVMLGKLKECEPMAVEHIAKEANEVTHLFNYLVSENTKIGIGHTFETTSGQVYFADRFLSIEEKQQLTTQASNYYQNSDYPVLLIRSLSAQ